MKKISILILLFIAINGKAQYFQHIYGTPADEVLTHGINTNFVSPQGHLMTGPSKYPGSTLGGVAVALTNVNGIPVFENYYNISNPGAIVNAADPKVVEITSPCVTPGNIAVVGRYTDNTLPPGSNTGIFHMVLDGFGNVIMPLNNYVLPGYSITEVGGVGTSLIFPGEIYITGTVIDAANVPYVFAMRINECSGAMTWSWIYNIALPAQGSYGKDIEENFGMPFGNPDVVIVGAVINGTSTDGLFFHISAVTGIPFAHPVILYGNLTSTDVLNSINRAPAAGTFTAGFVVSGATDLNSPGNMDFLFARTDNLWGPPIITTFDYSAFPVNNEAFDAIQRINSFNQPEFYVIGYTAQGAFGGSDVQVVKINAAGAGVGEYTYGGAGNDYGRSAGQLNILPTMPPPSGLSVFGTWGSAPTFGGSDLYHIKSYYNGFVPPLGCNVLFASPRQTTYPNPTVQMPVNTITSFSQYPPLSAFSSPISDIQLCYDFFVPGGSNARVAPDEDKDKNKSAVMPNPMETGTHAIIVEFEAETPGDVNITIYDMLGKKYYSGRFTSTKGTNRIPLDITDINMAAGMYNVTIVSGGNAMNQLLMVK